MLDIVDRVVPAEPFGRLATAMVAATVGLPSIPAWLPVMLLAFFVSQGVASMVAVPLAIYRSRAPDQHGVMYFDPRSHPPKFGLKWLDPDEYEDLELRWGDTVSLGTTPPIDLVLMFDRESLTAIGTTRSVMSPHELENNLFFAEQIWEEQEEDLVKLGELERTFRARVRQMAEKLVAESDSEFDEMTLPDGQSIREMLDSLGEARPDGLDAFEADSDGVESGEEFSDEAAEVVENAGDLARADSQNDD